MSISARIFLIMLAGFTAFVLLVLLAQNVFIAPSFEDLETREARQDMARTFLALDNEVSHLASLTRDWAAWDDSYRFVQGENPEYEASNLMSLVFQDLDINLIAFYDLEGRVVWSHVYDPEQESFVTVPGFPDQGTEADPDLLLPAGAVTGLAGVYMGDARPMVLALEPITTSSADAPSVGTLVMGRYVDQSFRDKVARQVRLDIAFWAQGGQDLPGEILDAARGMTLDEPARVEPASKNSLRVLDVYPDLFGRPALLVEADLFRPVMIQGKRAMYFNQLVIFLGGLTVMAVTLLSLQRLVVRPLSLLTGQVVRRRQSDAPVAGTEQMELDRSDEIGTLSREFAALLESLEQARDRSRKDAYRTGQSEMARGLVHNLRNTMTPLVTRLDMLLDDLHTAPLQDQARAKRELAEGHPDPDRREKLEAFLELCAERNVEILDKAREKLADLTRRADAVERVINDFERFTRGETLVEPVVLEDLVREALDLLPASMRARLRVKTIINLPDGRFKTNPPIMLQVLVHLLTNAAESLSSPPGEPDDQPPGSPANITVRAWVSEQGVRISMEDAGAGIAAQDLTRIFERDFSGSKDPRRGFGLHWCSGVLNQLGGRLTAQSEGPGRGAVFTIMLPNNP